MLAIRLQRIGRKGYPVYRVAVQESQKHPQSGRVVAQVGSYNPHSKEVKLDEAKIQTFLDNGAQPTERVVRLIKDYTKVQLPKWVVAERPKQTREIKNPDKLRRNRPAPEATDAITPAAE